MSKNDKYDYFPNPYFTERKLRCTASGDYHFSQKFLKTLIAIREEVGEPLVISSAYRSAKHEIERSKAQKGAHFFGRAVDFKVARQRAWKVVKAAMKRNLRVGVSQKGKVRFCHIDDMGTREGDPKRFPPKTIWSY